VFKWAFESKRFEDIYHGSTLTFAIKSGSLEFVRYCLKQNFSTAHVLRYCLTEVIRSENLEFFKLFVDHPDFRPRDEHLVELVKLGKLDHLLYLKSRGLLLGSSSDGFICTLGDIQFLFPKSVRDQLVGYY
jgi:hypothetical protein